MIKNKNSGKFNKNKVLIGGLALLMFFVGLALVMQGLIDTRVFRDKITQIIQLQTGRQVVIKGNVALNLLPVPTLFVPAVELRDAKTENSLEPIATIGMIRIEVSLLSILSEQPRITSLAFDQPVLSLVRAEDHLIHWGWVNTKLLRAIANEANPGHAIALSVTNGRVIYHDAITEKNVAFGNINFNANNGSRMYAKGSLTAYGHVLYFDFDSDNISESSEKVDSPFNFNLSSTDKSNLNIAGTMNFAGELPIVKGKLEGASKDLSSWLHAVEEDQKGVFDTVTNRVSKDNEDKSTYPVKFSGEWSQEGLSFQIKDFRYEGMNSAAIGDMSLSWEEWRPSIGVDLRFSALDYNQWNDFVSGAFFSESSDIIQKAYEEENEEGVLPRNILFSLKVSAEDLYVANQSWKNSLLNATLDDGSITVNQFSIELPGDSTLSLFGVVSPAAKRTLRFEGSMETQGKSLRNMLTVFDPSAVDLPETGFEKFFSHSNIFLSKEQLRLSEADVRLGELHLNGGMVFYFDEQPRVEADVKLKDINFDYFRDAWRERESKNIDKGKDFFLKFDKSMNFTWLKKLATTIDFRVNVDKFTFFEQDGTNASFRIYARNGDFGIYDMNFVYPADVMRGTFRLNVNGEKPLMNLSFSASEINTDYFNYEPTLLTEEEKRVKKDAAKRKLEELEKIKARATQNNKSEEGDDSFFVSGDPEAPITAVVTKDGVNGDALKSLQALPDSEGKSTPASSVSSHVKARSDVDDGKKLVIEPQAEEYSLPDKALPGEVIPPRPATGIDDLLAPIKSKKSNVIQNPKLNELLDMGWINSMSGVMDLNISRLIHKNINFDNFRLQASFGNDLFTFKTLTFNYWGGQCSIAGSMYGGKVPGFSVSLAFLNGNLQKALYDLTGRKNILGGIGVSATLATSGVNYLSWIQQAEGKVAIAGRGVNVHGFNLSGVTDAVNMSRTSADVANSVNRVIGNGSTTFSLDGIINIKNGSLRTPGMSLRTDTVMGNFSGEVRVLKWDMDLNTMFQFPALSSETVPTMSVQLTGPLDNGEIRTDTSSLEAYVAKRIISQ